MTSICGEEAVCDAGVDVSAALDAADEFTGLLPQEMEPDCFQLRSDAQRHYSYRAAVALTSATQDTGGTCCPCTPFRVDRVVAADRLW